MPRLCALPLVPPGKGRGRGGGEERGRVRLYSHKGGALCRSREPQGPGVRCFWHAVGGSGWKVAVAVVVVVAVVHAAAVFEVVVICAVWMRRGVLCAMGTPVGDVQRGPNARMCTCVVSQTGGRVEGRM